MYMDQRYESCIHSAKILSFLSLLFITIDYQLLLFVIINTLIMFLIILLLFIIIF